MVIVVEVTEVAASAQVRPLRHHPSRGLEQRFGTVLRVACDGGDDHDDDDAEDQRRHEHKHSRGGAEGACRRTEPTRAEIIHGRGDAS